jgi:hypothetical protein
MEDYIFLIVAIVLSVLSAISQNKKKKRTDQVTAEPKALPQNRLFDQLFSPDFFEEADEEKVQPVPARRVTTETTAIRPAAERFVRHEYKTTLPTIVRKVKPQPEMNDQLVDEEDEGSEEVSYLSDFSLRKAFVYSEILNRKY